MLCVNPQFKGVPNDKFVPAVAGSTKHGVAHVGMAVSREPDHTPTLPIEEAAFLGQEIIVLTEQPATIKQVVENPEVGSLDYRDARAFQRTVRALREALER